MDQTNMDQTSDTTMTNSQASQYMREKFPPGQDRRQDPNRVVTNKSSMNPGEILHLEIEQYSSILIARNNENSEDEGVHRILTHLFNEQPKKNILKDKNILKPQLLAGYCFLTNVALSEGKIKYKSMKSDELLDEIIIKNMT